MLRISDRIYADDAVTAMDFDKRPMASPYAELPFLLIGDFLSPEACRNILEAIDPSQMIDAGLLSGDKKIDETVRNTRLHAMPPIADGLYGAAFEEHRRGIESFFGVALAGASRPQLLEYLPGSFYRRHADDSSEIVDKTGRCVGYKKVAPQRVVTTVLFLNTQGEDFEGGTLRFNYLFDENGNPADLAPEAGTLVAFPSHPLFAHEVFPVTAGRRVTVAQWHNAV